MKTTPTRSLLLALALAAVALPGFAAIDKTPVLLSSWDIVTCANSADGSANFNGGNGSSSAVFNGTFGDYQMLPRAKNGSAFIIDFTQKAGAPTGGYYVTEIKVDSTGAKKYTLQYSTDGSTWTTVDGASGISPVGIASIPVGAVAKKVKYVFDEGSAWDFDTEYLAEIQVWGYTPAQPEVISSWDIVTCANSADGSANFNGGNGSSSAVFNGTFGDYQMLPRAKNGSAFIIDFTQKAGAPTGGYYVTEIKVDSTGAKKYTLQYSTDGSTWATVDGASAISPVGIATIPVGITAKKVKYVFDEGSAWDFDTEYLAEIQVLGLDPADIDCTHPTWTAWTAVANSATCTENGVEERFCTVCNERQARASDNVPLLGHDYVSTLSKAGSIEGYGSGTITCSRCDFSIDCTKPVDFSKFGGEKVEGKVQFTEEEVSTINHPDWGPSLKKMYDGDASSYWLAQSTNHTEFASLEFGVPVELTKIDLVVRNHDQVLEFYNDDGTTEKFLKEVSIPRDDTIESDYHAKTVFFWSDDENGSTVKKLVVRFRDGIGLFIPGWGYPAGVTLHELHPYGTVVGAGMPTPTPVFILMQ